MNKSRHGEECHDKLGQADWFSLSSVQSLLETGSGRPNNADVGIAQPVLDTSEIIQLTGSNPKSREGRSTAAGDARAGALRKGLAIPLREGNPRSAGDLYRGEEIGLERQTSFYKAQTKTVNLMAAFFESLSLPTDMTLAQTWQRPSEAKDGLYCDAVLPNTNPFCTVGA